MNEEYNKELILVHKFLKEQYKKFHDSNKLKTDDERLRYAHAIQTVGNIAYNTIITDKDNPREYKTKDSKYYNTVYDE
jgi:hypothetical protein